MRHASSLRLNEMNLQPTLKNELVKLIPLKEEDFETLYKAASDPLIWEQHPENNRFQRHAFEKFFKGAIDSRGAFLVIDNKTGEVIGSSRYYDYDENNNSIAIGFTFLTRKYWGTAYNRAMKTLMLDYAFKFVETVIFHIGEKNIRSQKAILKLGAKKINELKKSENSISFVYEIKKNSWLDIRKF
ncbi:MAG: GNAT family N-acetyltransferase [Ignavibacteriaceae bacterium]|nr:GNAT family N-acetyltransferase [Ignavibacteriaceae bacterium]